MWDIVALPPSHNPQFHNASFCLCNVRGGCLKLFAFAVTIVEGFTAEPTKKKEKNLSN